MAGLDSLFPLTIAHSGLHLTFKIWSTSAEYLATPLRFGILARQAAVVFLSLESPSLTLRFCGVLTLTTWWVGTEGGAEGQDDEHYQQSR